MFNLCFFPPRFRWKSVNGWTKAWLWPLNTSACLITHVCKRAHKGMWESIWIITHKQMHKHTVTSTVVLQRRAQIHTWRCPLGWTDAMVRWHHGVFTDCVHGKCHNSGLLRPTLSPQWALWFPPKKPQKNISFCLSVHFFLKRSPFILAVCQSQNLYNLLHLAASHGLWMVASFVLQQDGSREALRRADAQGQTAADVAKSRGHKKLGKLFTQWVPHSVFLGFCDDQHRFNIL